MPIKCDLCNSPAETVLIWGFENGERGKFCSAHADEVTTRVRAVGKEIQSIGVVAYRQPEALEQMDPPILPPPLPKPPDPVTTIIDPGIADQHKAGPASTKSIPESPKRFEIDFEKLRASLAKKSQKAVGELWEAFQLADKERSGLQGRVEQLIEGIETYRHQWMKSQVLLEAHRKFHQVGCCPGLPDCAVCAAEDNLWRTDESIESWEALVGQYVVGPRISDEIPPLVQQSLEQQKAPTDPAEAHTLASAPTHWTHGESK